MTSGKRTGNEVEDVDLGTLDFGDRTVIGTLFKSFFEKKLAVHLKGVSLAQLPGAGISLPISAFQLMTDFLGYSSSGY